MHKRFRFFFKFQTRVRKTEGEVVPVHPVKANGGAEVQLNSFPTSALDEGERLA